MPRHSRVRTASCTRQSAILAELETAVALSETCPVLTEAARRWLTRRRDAVHTCLRILITLMPERFRLCQPTVLGLCDRLGHADVQPTLCALLALRRMSVVFPWSEIGDRQV